MIDAYSREVNYLRLSVTDLCNLRCQYCMPEQGIEKSTHDNILSFEDIDKIVSAFVSLGIDKVRITGGEPLIKKDIVKLIQTISKHEGIKDLALTTNGLLLKSMAKSLKVAGLNRVNVSLDSLNEKKYSMMTRGGKLKDALAGIEMAKKVNLMPIKINVVLINGFNEDEIEDFVSLTRYEDIEVRFIELMPIGEVSKWSLNHFLPNSYVLEKVPNLIKLNDKKPSVAVNYKLPNGKGKVGLISPISCKFCYNCNRVRVTSGGILKYCLHSDKEYNLKKVINNKESLIEYIKNSILLKPLEHNIEEGIYIKRNMVQVGG